MSLPDLRGLLRTLAEGNVDFVVIGGVAVAAHGYVRATEDVDLVPNPDAENLEALANLLVGLDARLSLNEDRAVGPDERQALHQGRNLSVATPLGDLDIVSRMPGVPAFREIAAAAVVVPVDGVEVKVCSREHLMAMKRARSSAIDLADLEHLEEAQG